MMTAIEDARERVARWVAIYEKNSSFGDRTGASYESAPLHLSDIQALLDATTPPTDDEREALDYAIRVPLSEARLDYKPFWKLVKAVQDSVESAGFRRQGPITDAQVKAALIGYYSTNGGWVSDKDHWINEFVPNMRAALEAARDA